MLSISLNDKTKWYNSYLYDYDKIIPEEFIKLFENEN